MVKKITCVQNTIPTQCIVQKTMQPKKGSMAGVKSIATKVVVQMNCKIGGMPWMVSKIFSEPKNFQKKKININRLKCL